MHASRLDEHIRQDCNEKRTNNHHGMTFYAMHDTRRDNILSVLMPASVNGSRFLFFFDFHVHLGMRFQDVYATFTLRKETSMKVYSGNATSLAVDFQFLRFNLGDLVFFV
jgi:hypothetical protein